MRRRVSVWCDYDGSGGDLGVHLFDPITIRGIEIRNRLWLPPMCQYSAASEGEDLGRPNNWHFQHYASRAVGGFGVVTVEATAITPVGRISPQCLVLNNDDISAFAYLAQVISEHGALPAIQIGHAGRKGSSHVPWVGRTCVQPEVGGWETIAPSAIRYDENLGMPREMTTDEIRETIDQFAKSAELAVRAGFRAIELHAAHGYLIHQFLSPVSNHRHDEWGGDFEGRTRFLREIVRTVRSAIGDVPLFARVSATDWLAENFSERDGNYGWTVRDTIRLVEELPEVDFWNVSTGGNLPVKVHTGPGYQVPFARRIKEETGAMVGVAGLIANANQAAVVVHEEDADVVYIGRVALHDPYVPRHWATHLDENIAWPNQYVRGFGER